MFGKTHNSITNLQEQLRHEKHERELERQRLDQDKALALNEKEFELKHFKDEETKALSEKLAKANQEIAVLKKENEMLDKITNLNADIIDIKDLVNKLVEKLPTINLSSLTVQNGPNQK